MNRQAGPMIRVDIVVMFSARHLRMSFSGYSEVEHG